MRMFDHWSDRSPDISVEDSLLHLLHPYPCGIPGNTVDTVDMVFFNLLYIRCSGMIPSPPEFSSMPSLQLLHRPRILRTSHILRWQITPILT
jgi:hypothetical protein